MPNHSIDAKDERAVLDLVLAVHPGQLTEDELVREIVNDPDVFSECDGVIRAVRDLVGVGLMHRHGAFVLPSRAAVRADALWSESAR